MPSNRARDRYHTTWAVTAVVAVVFADLLLFAAMRRGWLDPAGERLQAALTCAPVAPDDTLFALLLALVVAYAWSARGVQDPTAAATLRRLYFEAAKTMLLLLVVLSVFGLLLNGLTSGGAVWQLPALRMPLAGVLAIAAANALLALLAGGAAAAAFAPRSRAARRAWAPQVVEGLALLHLLAFAGTALLLLLLLASAGGA